jgi:hypothetical protein
VEKYSCPSRAKIVILHLNVLRNWGHSENFVENIKVSLTGCNGFTDSRDVLPWEEFIEVPRNGL